MRTLSVIALATATIGASLFAAGPAAAANPSVTINDEYAVESVPGQKNLLVPLTLSGRADVTVQVQWSTSNGTATAGTDFVSASGTTSFSVGQTRRDITLQLLGDDTAEPDEKFTVKVTGVTGATIADGTAEVLVIDDEGSGGSQEPVRDCNDNYAYTTDAFSATAGHCTHTVRNGADDDGDRSAAAQVGGPDCNDAAAAVKPGAVEVAGDGIDNNCDGITDSGPRNCTDNNPYTTDTYSRNRAVCTHALILTADRDADTSAAAQVGGADCNDANPAVRPGTAEVPGNSVDDNCDGLIDDGRQGPPPVTDGVTVIPGSPLYCPAGDACMQVVVRCAGTPPVRGYVAIGAPTAPVRGVLVMFTGARGQNYWGVEDETVVDDLQAEGFEVDRVAWPDGWGELAQGPTGSDIAGCRPSTITKWLHDTRYVPLGLSGAVGECGFCVGGNSGGSTQAAYGLSEYGLDKIVDAAVLTSGPALAALAEGCLGVPAQYSFDAASRGQVDKSYGSSLASGNPCTNKNPAWEAIWREDSIVDGANDLVHPTTRLDFIQGGLDTSSTPPGVDLYIDRLTAAGSPLLSKTVYPNAGHGLKPMLGDPAARQGIIDAFAWSP